MVRWSILAFALPALLAVTPVLAQPTVEVVYWDSPIESPCGEGSESVRYYGEVEIRRHDRLADDGSLIRSSTTINYRWLEAIGLESGEPYDVSGAFHATYVPGGGGRASGETYVNRLHLRSPDGANDIHYDELLRVTVSPQGELVVTQDHSSVSCR